jgi:imidazolonepropionase-like amidohydrolase
LLLRQAQVVDVKAGKVLANRQVWIVDDTIRAVAPADSLLPPAQDTFQLGGRYLMPGLTDSHVHYFQSGGLYTRPDVIDLRFLHDYQQELGWLSTHVSDLWTRYLAAGITTTIDLGGPLNNYRLRDQADSAALAPNLWVTGPLLSSYLPQELDSSDPPILKIDSPTAGRAAVQAQLPYQPDFIKIWYIVLPGQSVETFRPVAAAIIDEAHRHHLPVAVHATELATARAAVESGADLLVHSVDDQLVDSAFVALLLDRGVAYCPTLTVSESYEEVLANHLDVKPVDWALAHPATLGSLSDLARVADDQLPPWAQALRAQPYQAPAKLPIMYANLRRLAQAGVPILTGTDAGNIGTLHASSYFEELAAMESAGMSPAALLRASTYEAAQFFGKRTGLVAPGYAADLLLLDQNPLEDWHHWYPATAVVRKGTFYHPDELIPRTTETVVLDFLNAWRWGDIPRLRSLMHPSVIHYRNGQQFAGATGVGLIWTSKTVPPGSPRLIDQGKQIRVEWGELSWVFVVVKGSIRKIYGP